MEKSNKECDQDQVELLSRALSFSRKPELKSTDELGVALLHDNPGFQRIRFLLSNSHWNAQDQRDQKNTVAFIPLESFLLNTFLTNDLWSFGITAPRRLVIDTHDRFAKIVALVFVMCGNELLLVPRGTKRILPDVFTLSVMESLTLDDLYQTFREPIYVSQFFGEAPRSISYTDPFNTIDAEEGYMNTRSILEECPEIIGYSPVFTGLVGGGKDLGLVWGVNVNKRTMRAINLRSGGITFDISKYTYTEVASYYGGKIDGWSQSILKYASEHK
ncbi:hypothetical protein JW766_02150 [Candidatus Dojkabacteria bacterium]|nr:hypothetical protein [Candidatus Dojkabacteria bacterium]